MQPNYQDKEWLQKEINRLGTAQDVAKENGWGNTTVARWVKRLEVQYPKNFIKENKDYQDIEWLKSKLEECGSGAAISRKYKYSKTTINNWLNKYNLISGNPMRTKKAQSEAESTYKDKYWLEEKMKECKTAKNVANKYGYSETTIQRWTNHFGMSSRTTNSDSAIYKNKEWLKVQFSNGRTIQEVAEQCGVSRSTIQSQISQYEIDTKKLQSIALHPYKNKEWLKEKVEIHGSGNKISKIHNLPTTSVNRYIKKYNLIPNDIKHPITLKLDEDFFEDIDTEEKAYWLGFMMADGYVYRKQTKTKDSYMVGIKLQKKDEIIIQKFKKTLKTNARIKKVNSKRGEKTYEAREISFYSEKMAFDLMKNGVIPRKTGKETIPKNLKKRLLSHFVRGYFDGDGSSVGGVFKVCCSHFFYQELKSILTKEGIKVDFIYRYHLSGTEVLAVHRKREVEKIAKWMYKDATVYLDRKKENYIEKGFLKESPSIEQSMGEEGELLESPESFSTTT